MVYRSIAVHRFPYAAALSLTDGSFLRRPFILYLPANLAVYPAGSVLLNVPGALKLCIGHCRAVEDTNGARRREGCFAFSDDTLTLDAVCRMRVTKGEAVDTFTLSIPLAEEWIARRRLALWFDGTWIRFLADGEVLNENSGLDGFCDPTGVLETDTRGGEFAPFSADTHTVDYRTGASDCLPGYYYPHGINANVGDVMSFFHDGTYHLLYLFDRRHHRSRNGAGVHYIAHLTTSDFIDWYEQPPVVELTAPWMSCGTGTMLFAGGRYYMTYGLHTERYRGDNPKFEPVPDGNGNYHTVSITSVLASGAVPAGSTYSVSDDGIHFQPSGQLYHVARNPSAYVDPQGGIKLYAGFSGSGNHLMTGGGGVYTAPRMEDDFCLSDEMFDYIFHSPMRNTSECPSFFEWNGYRYLLVGFTGYYRSMKKGGALEDAAGRGENIYDGLAVPMVTAVGGGRYIMAGWAECALGWGSLLFQRELVQEEGGKLGTKWVSELVPVATGSRALTADALTGGVSLNAHRNYRLCFTVTPRDAARVGLSFGNGATGCTVEWNIREARAQVGTASYGEWAPRIPTMLEQMRTADPAAKEYRAAGATDIVRDAHDYALPDFDNMGEKLAVRVTVYRSKRIHATVLDIEVNARRTMLTVRDGFFPTAVCLLADGAATVENAALDDLPTPEFPAVGAE